MENLAKWITSPNNNTRLIQLKESIGKSLGSLAYVVFARNPSSRLFLIGLLYYYWCQSYLPLSMVLVLSTLFRKFFLSWKDTSFKKILLPNCASDLGKVPMWLTFFLVMNKIICFTEVCTFFYLPFLKYQRDPVYNLFYSVCNGTDYLWIHFHNYFRNILDVLRILWILMISAPLSST